MYICIMYDSDQQKQNCTTFVNKFHVIVLLLTNPIQARHQYVYEQYDTKMQHRIAIQSDDVTRAIAINLVLVREYL